MGKVLAFRKPEEICGTCWYYIISRESKGEESPPSGGYCRHPDRMKQFHLNLLPIEKIGMHRLFGQWCPKFIHINSPVMKKLQSVSGIKFALCILRRSPVEHNAVRADTSSDEYRELLNLFYEEHKKIMTINQYKAAKRDVEHFINLIDDAFKYYKKKIREQRYLDRK